MLEHPEKSAKHSKKPMVIAAITTFLALSLGWLVVANFFGPEDSKTVPLTSAAPVFVADELGFSIKFPAAPERQDQVLDSGGQDLSVTTFSAGQLTSGFGLSTTMAICTPVGEDLDARLAASAAGTIEGAAESTGFTPTVNTQKPLTVAGSPALLTDFTLAKGSDTLHVMSVIVINGPRFYTLSANNPSEESWSAFLGSFTITEDPAALPECAPMAGA